MLTQRVTKTKYFKAHAGVKFRQWPNIKPVTKQTLILLAEEKLRDRTYATKWANTRE